MAMMNLQILESMNLESVLFLELIVFQLVDMSEMLLLKAWFWNTAHKEILSSLGPMFQVKEIAPKSAYFWTYCNF